VTRLLIYFGTKLITDVKSFIVQALGQLLIDVRCLCYKTLRIRNIRLMDKLRRKLVSFVIVSHFH